jgi:hypothetical protein
MEFTGEKLALLLLRLAEGLRQHPREIESPGG